MFVVRSPIALLGQCMLDIKRRCIKLIATVCGPYVSARASLYARADPNWFAKVGVVPTGRSFVARQIRARRMANRETLLTSSLFLRYRLFIK